MSHRCHRIVLILLVGLLLLPGGVGIARTSQTDAVTTILADLQGLGPDDFFEESYRQLLLRSPEGLTERGITADFGLRNDQLDDLSDTYLHETQALEAGILDLLRGYDRATLTPEQQVSYDVYEDYLDIQVQGHTFMYHNYALNHFINSYHFNLESLFTELHPLVDRADVEDYISRLAQVKRQVDQLMEGLTIREEMGIIPPRFIVEMALYSLRDTAGIQFSGQTPNPARHPFYVRLDEALADIPGLSDADKAAFREEALSAVEESVIPAYVTLIDYLDGLRAVATTDAGVWKLPGGEAYYAYLLRRETGTDLTPADIHAMGLAEVERIQAEMRDALVALGYPADENLARLWQRAQDDAGYYPVSTEAERQAFVTAIEGLITAADARTSAVFAQHPAGEVIVVDGDFGGYYVPGTADGSRPGIYHATTGGNWRPKINLATVVYHETIPGHHLQIALAQEMDSPFFRNDIMFNGYVEGWALYAEQLAYELGLYEDNPYGNLGRLQFELLRAIRLVEDTGIHAMGWTREEANAYMNENMPGPRGAFAHEIDRYIVLPAQATGYKIGMMHILDLRRQAMDALGDNFELAEFHGAVLGSGSLPLEMLDQTVEAYIAEKLND